MPVDRGVAHVPTARRSLQIVRQVGVAVSVSSMLRRGLVGLVGIGLWLGCARNSVPLPSSGESKQSSDEAMRGPHCFDVVAGDNSPSTRRVFRARQCQGGGVTWAAVMDVLLQKRGSGRRVEEPLPGWTGDVRALSWKGKTVRVAIDEEGDSARFCTDSNQLLADIRSDVARVNANPAELEHTMEEANPRALECFEDDP